jgi:hypothetical protein
MPYKTTNTKNRWVLLPVTGIAVFVLLYFIATILYPGGSQADSASKGFSWLHNYWCNLLNENGINGEYNPGRYFAITGMLVLCVSMAFFWFQFAKLIPFNNQFKIAMQASAIASACCGFFLFTRYHDTIINITGLLAFIALAGTFAGLYKTGWRKLFWLGIFNIVLIAINNLIYYNKPYIAYLPVVQKITFAFFLVWICLINVALFRLGKQPTGQVQENY